MQSLVQVEAVQGPIHPVTIDRGRQLPVRGLIGVAEAQDLWLCR